MPAQGTSVATNPTVFYVEGDTAPTMDTVLVDEETGETIDLTDPSTLVTVSIAWASPHGSYYSSPRDRIVSEAACTIDADQVTNPGLVHWQPAPGDLTPPGQFLYQHEVDFDGDGLRVQTVPANTYQPLIIRSKVGGRAFNKSPISGN